MSRRAALAAGLLLVGLGLRMVNYTTTPAWGSNRDELAWAWAGQSLIEQHSPSSWSYLPAYPKVATQLTSDGWPLPLVSPWFDHPPTFAALVGAVAIAGGQNQPGQVDAHYIRLVPILLSLLAAYLAFLLTRRHLDNVTAFLALTLLCISPWAVEASRLVESEWLLAPTLLGALLLLEMDGRRAMVGLVALCLIAPTVKVPGIAIGVACAVVLASRHRWKVSFACGAAAAGGIGLFVGYGALIDWHQFVAVWRAHSDLRAPGLGAILATGNAWLTGATAGLGRVPKDIGPFLALGDPLWVIGLLGLGLLALRHPLSPLVVATVVFAAVIATTADPVWSPNYAWYRVAVYPLAYIGVADLVARSLPEFSRLRRQVGNSQSFRCSHVIVEG